MELLLLSGMLCDAASWGGIETALADRARIAHPGYGSADTVQAMAEAVLDAAPPRFALAGHSMGGRVALMVQHMAPGRVIGLGLIGTSAEGPGDAARREAEADRRRRQIGMAEAGGGPLAFATGGWMEQVFAPASLEDRGLRRAFLDMVARRDMATMRAQTHAGLTRPEMTGWLADIRCPVLVLAGEMDRGRPPEVHRQTAARIPGAVLELVPGAGHMVMMENPGAVAGAMRLWLDRISAREAAKEEETRR